MKEERCALASWMILMMSEGSGNVSRLRARAACTVVAGAVAAAFVSAAAAQERRSAYPDRPVRVIVPVAAAGSTDIIARIVLTKLADVTSRQYVINNRPGAGGIVGNEIVAKARP